MVYSNCSSLDLSSIDGNRPWDQMLPKVTPTSYPTEKKADRFTIDAQAVLQAVRRRDAVIIDARPADYYRGEKSDEARAGHIPGAVNHPHTEDVIDSDTGTTFKSTAELSQTYAALIPSPGQQGYRSLPHRSPGQPDLFCSGASPGIHQCSLV